MAKTPEEIAADEKAAEEAAEQAAEEEEEEGDEFDPDRARATIKKQRESEKNLKAELREARKAEEELAAIKQAQEDADKSASEKLAERDETIKGLHEKIMETAVKADFEREAAERGITDLSLAYLAAKEQGLLGAADPKTGEVDKHDFDKLEELYPTLQGEGTGWQPSGDAGARGKQKTKTVASVFNESVRSSFRR